MEPIKVHFKGESMWVDPVEVSEDKMAGSLANYPINSATHGYGFGDYVECHRVYHEEIDVTLWEPIHAVNPRPSSGLVSQYTPADIFERAKESDNG